MYVVIRDGKYVFNGFRGVHSDVQFSTIGDCFQAYILRDYEDAVDTINDIRVTSDTEMILEIKNVSVLAKISA